MISISVVCICVNVCVHVSNIGSLHLQKKIVGIKFRQFPEVLQSRVTSSKVLIHCEGLMRILSFTSGNVASDWTPKKWRIWCLFNKDSRFSCDTHVQISHHMALFYFLSPAQHIPSFFYPTSFFVCSSFSLHRKWCNPGWVISLVTPVVR